METVCVATGLRRHYGETVALDGVDLTIRRGEMLGLVGPNGAGKTTLVRALTGTTVAEGTVEVFGREPQAVDRQRIGVLPQAFSPPDRLTPQELVEYYAGLYDGEVRTEQILEAVGLAEAADTYYEALSGGQQRRACVATALVHDPELVILDEPTTGVDPSGRRALWRLLEALSERGSTVVFTTHYMAEAEELADRVGLMADGKFVAIDRPGALVSEYGGESRLEIVPRGDGLSAQLPPDARVVDGTVVVDGVSPAEIGSVVERLADAGLSYDEVRWTEPDLEDVYHRLTDPEPTHGEGGS